MVHQCGRIVLQPDWSLPGSHAHRALAHWALQRSYYIGCGAKTTPVNESGSINWINWKYRYSLNMLKLKYQRMGEWLSDSYWAVERQVRRSVLRHVDACRWKIMRNSRRDTFTSMNSGDIINSYHNQVLNRFPIRNRRLLCKCRNRGFSNRSRAVSMSRNLSWITREMKFSLDELINETSRYCTESIHMDWGLP